MKITKIKILKSKVTVTFDKKKKIELSKDSFTNYYLYEGKDVSNKELKKIEEDSSNNELMSYALKLRSKKLVSEYKMREKLYEKGGNKRSVDYIIKTLKSHDLIDDDAFIVDYIEYYNSLNYGENKIREKLKEKGIFEEKLSKVKFPVSIEKKKASNILVSLEKKYDKYNQNQKKQHIYNAYLNAGFSIDIAKDMVDHIKLSSPKEENEKLKKDFDKAYVRLSRKYQKKELRNKIIQALLTKGYKMNDILKLMEKKL